MSFETALRSRLKAAVGAAGFVEWDERPQGKDVGIVLSIITADRAQHMARFQPKRSTRVQLMVSALDAPTKVAIREATVAAIGVRTTVAGVAFERARSIEVIGASQRTETRFIHRDAIDAMFWFREVEN